MVTKGFFPYLGFGLGLRPKHYDAILAERPEIDWFEILTENYLDLDSQAVAYLDHIRAFYPIVMHGVSLSIGSSDVLNKDYLRKVKCLAERMEPAWISDHLCWTGIHHVNTHDLLPLPYTSEALKLVVSHIQQAQDFLGRQILIENVSSYLSYSASEMTEWDFLSAVVKEADCFILLDVNNVYVSAQNHQFDAYRYLDALPVDKVVQIHLAGHTQQGSHLIDTHDALVIQPVWDLYAAALKRFGRVSTMIERDDHIPDLAVLLLELDAARRVADGLLLS